MAKISRTDLLEAFKDMTLLELSEFVKQFEETFDVTAAPPVVVPGPGPGDTPAEAEEPDEQAEFDVVLQAVPDKRIQVIKEVRTLAKLGLKEAKDLVDTAPVTVLAKVSRETAGRAQAALEAAGGTVTLQ